MGKFRGLDTDEGWIRRELAALRRDLTEQAAARRLVVAAGSVQVDLSGVALGTGFAEVASVRRTVTVPTGFTHAIINMFASAGTTFNVGQSGNIGVQPATSVGAGSGISQGGNSIATSVNSTLARTAAVGASFDVWVEAYANGGTRAAGSDNVHLSASIMFVRL